MSECVCVCGCARMCVCVCVCGLCLWSVLELTSCLCDAHIVGRRPDTDTSSLMQHSFCLQRENGRMRERIGGELERGEERECR